MLNFKNELNYNGELQISVMEKASGITSIGKWIQPWLSNNDESLTGLIGLTRINHLERGVERK